MSDAQENTSVTDAQVAKRPWYRRAWLRYTVVTILLLLHVQLLLGSYAGRRHRHTCVICRLERTDYKWRFWSPTTTYNETTCSQWYQSHVEGSHDHVWSPGPTIALLNFYGQAIGVGDNFDHPGRAVWVLTPDEQISIYKHFPKRADAKKLFASLTDPDVMDTRSDYSITYSLREWMESGFIGQWRTPNDVREPSRG